ncbi:cation-translocating P-type ATPase [Prevotella sp. KH2C16]|uniref:heavy metal translocating P-type ATPase n=1 Tax=Prevotella sp. KH2C16 TaxID=1855325 RepID=UPI0008E23F34|nr:heavy metal translocating P-type ATPase [Prevotella sp. KH2C16]SFF92491.1 Cu2+-exporting ATPase [Prevotella sp. KH2C16]
MKKTIPVIGMACASCSANVERKLNSLEGVREASVSLPGRSALVDYDPAAISLETMKKEINGIGYDLVIESDRSAVEIERREYQQLKRKTVFSWVIALLVMCISMGWIWLGSRDIANQTSLILSLANLVYCGRGFYLSAWRQIRHGSANMDTLVALSTAIAFLFSAFNTFLGDAVWGARGIEWHTYFDASVMIITFVLTGRLIEEKAKNGTASSIRQLMGLAPKTAHIVDGDKVEEVPISTIEVGDVLEVSPGEKVPVDGEVIWATSFMTEDAAYVDESMITGEPTPAEKRRGSKVMAGTIPSQGRFRFRARQIGENTALAHIIQMVQQAQGSKAPVQRAVDRVALVFVPVVAVIALVTFFLWWGIGGNAELPHAILSAVAVLVIACPCAMGLATPTALMVGIGKAAEKQVLIKDATALESLRTVDAMVIDKTGTLTIPNQNIDFTKADDLPLEERETLKPHAREAMTALQEAGIEVYMMSGDREAAAKYWADKAGISHYQSEVLPQDKENLVRKLQAEGRKVAMVGDGINDTQALALADASIAMGRGTDVAMDVAQVTLMGDDLRNIPEAVRLSKKTVRMIWENLFWAFIYNLVCIPLAAGVLRLFGLDFQITPMWASALMAFSSVSVVLNSLRLKFL